MHELKPPFVTLPKPSLEPLDQFSLDSAFYEQEMKTRTGIDLTSLESMKAADDEWLLTLAPSFPSAVDEANNVSFKIRDSLSMYKEIEGPCSMLVHTLDELAEHLLKAYQISFAHYVLGKKYVDKQPIRAWNLDTEKLVTKEGTFPEHFCGKTSSSVRDSLLKFGYPNAAVVETHRDHHAYVVLPFVLNAFKGNIIIDPTADQLWRDKIRNAAFIKSGAKWEYRTDYIGIPLSAYSPEEAQQRFRELKESQPEIYEDIGNLYPDCVEYMTGKDPKDHGASRNVSLIHHGLPIWTKDRKPKDTAQYCFEQALANPIDISEYIRQSFSRKSIHNI